jgi:cyclohexanecarboxylate-CoA ligase/acyl-CoA synthetase
MFIPTVDDRHRPETVRGFYETGMWRDEVLTTILDKWCAQQPERVYVSDGYGELSYAQVRGQAYRLAARLRELGVGAGDRVVVQLPNWNEFVVIYLALARLGAVLVPIMPVYRHDEVAYITEHTAARGLFTTGVFRGFDHLAMVRELRPRWPWLRFVGAVRAEAAPGELALTDLTEPTAGERIPAEAELGAPPGPDDAHVIIFTSGTEARPKGCFHTFNTLGFTLRALGRTLRLGPDDVTFMPSPVTHSTGLAMGLGAPLVTGGSVHLMDVWEPAAGLRRIREHRCTTTTTAAPFAQMAVDAYDPARDDVTSLRVWLCGGAPVPRTLVERVAAAWPGSRLLSLYGRSETFLSTVCELDDSVDRVAQSDGRAGAGVEITVLDEEGTPLPAHAEGEIAQRGPGVMLGYWRDRERTAAIFDGQGWCHSGDLGRFDDDGYLRVTGRLKDLIIRGGVNISAREVEEHLLAHPKVAGVALVAMPDPLLGERACACVVPAGDPPTLGELTDFLRHERRIAVTKLPERLEIVEALPMTATGKVRKFELRERIRSLVEHETAAPTSTREANMAR